MENNFVYCSFCKKKITRRKNWIKENVKLNRNNYCSLECLGKSRKKRKFVKCDNPQCKKIIERNISQLSLHIYCSRSCAAVVNNKKYPKRIAVVKKCKVCGKLFKGGAKKYCSVKCQNEGATVKGDKLLRYIIEFYENNNRIPFKRELSHYTAIRGRFGTWNNAIKAAGFDPNPVMFAKKYTANDGHICDSLSEKIIDDWLFARRIRHEINYPYPSKNGYTVDFKVKDYWVEFFGLTGQLRSYDDLKRKKMKIAKKCSLKLIKIYPRDIFPVCKLEKKLGELMNL